MATNFPVNLKYPREAYATTWSRVGQFMTEREAKKEYGRLRSIAQGRLRSLQKSEFANTSTAQREWVTDEGEVIKGFPSVSDLSVEWGGALRKKEFAKALVAVTRFLESSTSTVTGMQEYRRKALETLQAHGYNISAEQFLSFGEFMQEFRAEYGRKARGSEEAVDLFETMEHADIPTSYVMGRFRQWLENKEKIKALIDRERGSLDGWSADKIIDKVTKGVDDDADDDL